MMGLTGSSNIDKLVEMQYLYNVLSMKLDNVLAKRRADLFEKNNEGVNPSDTDYVWPIQGVETFTMTLDGKDEVVWK